jgi:hypothetical protein
MNYQIYTLKEGGKYAYRIIGSAYDKEGNRKSFYSIKYTDIQVCIEEYRKLWIQQVEKLEARIEELEEFVKDLY